MEICEKCQNQGCGVEFYWDDDMPVICGEDNFKTGHTQLCDKCQNQSPQNNSKEFVLSTNEDKTELENDFSATSGSDFCLSDKKYKERKTYPFVYRESDVNFFIDKLAGDLK